MTLYRVFSSTGLSPVYDLDDYDEVGQFATAEEALAAARGVIDRSLQQIVNPGMSAAELYDQFTSLGTSAFIRSPDGQEAPEFVSFDYARQRCAEICEAS
jgi:hypothetical protein